MQIPEKLRNSLKEIIRFGWENPGHGYTCARMLEKVLKEAEEEKPDTGCKADVTDLLAEQDRVLTFLNKINASARYFAWRDRGEDPGVVLPPSPPLEKKS